MSAIIVNPAGDKGILANPVIIEKCIIVIVRIEFGGIYDMERSSTEIGFEHDLESMKFGILTEHVEIKRMREARIPERD